MDQKAYKYRPLGVVRKLDQLGRVSLPKKIRDAYDMDNGAAVEIFVDGDRIIVERYYPRCTFCGSRKGVRIFKEQIVCEQCTEDLLAIRLRMSAAKGAGER
ncbi:AbrB/MazE/SpoVT family DNA-binding domain-containing protein [Paenibacillus rubinfantis]|uniref:AbrB/MazE/SpoVT family DNA-binding domain-containing protein n=1 Tax=Paenibacillus rubinfantis TaxID=1720296 RepID=UPI00073E9582|nr:AbrB/MazE/SpoVT family DNA-binding domain-containing protein [Paenibacillus rubinfantis]